MGKANWLEIKINAMITISKITILQTYKCKRLMEVFSNYHCQFWYMTVNSAI